MKEYAKFCTLKDTEMLSINGGSNSNIAVSEVGTGAILATCVAPIATLVATPASVAFIGAIGTFLFIDGVYKVIK